MVLTSLPSLNFHESDRMFMNKGCFCVLPCGTPGWNTPDRPEWVRRASSAPTSGVLSGTVSTSCSTPRPSSKKRPTHSACRQRSREQWHNHHYQAAARRPAADQGRSAAGQGGLGSAYTSMDSKGWICDGHATYSMARYTKAQGSADNLALHLCVRVGRRPEGGITTLC